MCRSKDASTVRRFSATLSVGSADCLTMHNNNLPRLLLLVGALLLGGCATSSLFNPYPNQASHWKQLAASGQGEAALARLEKGTRSKDRLLYLQESARVAQLTDQPAESQQLFTEVIGLYDEQDEQARIRASSAGSGLGALMVNDNALPYRGQDYERIAVHGLQALNYWQQQDIEGAGVEFRRLTLEQRVIEQRHEQEIGRAEDDAASSGAPGIGDFEGQFAGLNSAAALVRSSIQNPYFYYLAGVFREGTGQYNDALVDYKKAYEIAPQLAQLKTDIQRLDTRQRGRRQRAQGQVVIAYEQGYIPPREEISLPIPTIHGYFAVSFPTYSGDTLVPRPLQITTESGTQAHTEVIARFDGMAARALREQVPAMLVRQTLRAATKYSAQKAANDELGLLGALTTQLYNLVSERADLRSWLTLPANAQIARLTLPPGTQQLALSGPGGSANVEIPVVAGGTTLVRVIDTGQLHITIMPVLEEP